MKLLDTKTKKRIDGKCTCRGFVRKGQAYFRVIGDGVLQIIKFQYERCPEHYELHIGLQSMYGSLSKQCFTSGSCIPRYSVLNLVSRSNAVTIRKDNGLIFFTVTPPEEQLSVLIDKGFDWLDSICTQEQLVNAMIYLDRQSCGSVIWNNAQKIAPYLACGQTESAQRVINAILQQRQTLHSGKDNELLLLQKWIREADMKAIIAYLDENYVRNHQYADFCVQG